MVTLRKDSLNNEIRIGDVVVWGNSSRYSGTEMGIVLKYNPKLILVSGGSNVDSSKCVVITEQLKVSNPELLKRLIDENKDNFVPIISNNAKITKTIEAKIIVPKKVLSNNHLVVDLSGKIKIAVSLFHNGVLQGECPIQKVAGNTWRTKNNFKFKTISKGRIKEDGLFRGFTYKTDGKSLRISKYTDGKASDYRLTQSAIKKLTNSEELSSMVLEFNSLQSLHDTGLFNQTIEELEEALR